MFISYKLITYKLVKLSQEWSYSSPLFPSMLLKTSASLARVDKEKHSITVSYIKLEFLFCK